MDELQKEYELAYLVTEKENTASIFAALEKQGAQITAKNEPVFRELSYAIRKHKSAFFGFCIFSVSPEKIEKIDGELKKLQHVIRFFIVQTPKKTPSRREHHPKPQDTPKRSEPMSAPQVLTNEDLEQKLEEILK